MIFLEDDFDNAEIEKMNIETLKLKREICKEDIDYFNFRMFDYGAVLNYAGFCQNDVVIDIGGACSYIFTYIAQFVKESWCIDSVFTEYEEHTIKWLRTLCKYKSYIKGNARVVIQNASIMPFVDNYFDKVYTISALEHFLANDDSECVKEIYRTLKPNGIFIGTVDYNGIREYPISWANRAYTYESFEKRILDVCDWVVIAENKAIRSPKTEKSQQLFFALQKRGDANEVRDSRYCIQ